MYTELLAATVSLWDQFARVFDILGIILQYSPYWGPPVLISVFWRVWIRYIRARFLAEQEYTLFELRLPTEVMKSPVAMQAVFDGIWFKAGETTFIDRIWLGKTRMWYSFELVSTEGQVHLYVWVKTAFKKLVERSFYAHYPDIEIVEVEDYAHALPVSLDTHNLWGLDFKLSGPIGLPIKTYSEYGLDQTSTKEEQKIDPMAHILELLGSIGKGEHIWIQILARSHRKEDITYGPMRNFRSYDELAQMEISRVRQNPEETVVFPDGGTGKSMSDSQLKRVQAINKNMLSSARWDVGMRSIYIAEHEHFDGTTVPGMISMWQPFGAPGYNSIILEGGRWHPIFEYPWQDFNGVRENKKKINIVDAYRRRSWFHAPYRFWHFMLTSEELATLFHIPGSVAKTPTIQRIGSTRAQAPSNLPT